MNRIIATLVFVALPAFAAADVADVVNSVRAASCGKSSRDIEPLRLEPGLDNAARRLADGMSLRNATAEAQYPAKLSASIRVRTLQGEQDLARTLQQRFCDIVADPRLTEIGIYEHGAEAWIVLATPFTPPDSVDPAELNRQVLELINEAREQGRRCGRKKFSATVPLRANAALEQAARTHAQDMAENNFLGHEGSSGSLPGERANSAGYAWSSVGENVAAGQTTAEEVVGTWLDSTGHCENLMSPDYSETGVAHAISRSSDKGTYWVQIFGSPK
ncbi:MAG: CAP domain-containing protein [Gammaproteobacteria bacterium]|nr:CAP domain-containing protein [Gammaproteobacteria bacterium]